MASNAIAQCTVAVIGHSFVRHLKEWTVANNVYNMNLDSSRVQVFLHGVGGAVVTKYEKEHRKSIWCEASLIRDLGANAVVLDIGSNLCCPNVDSGFLTECIMEFAYYSLNSGATCVIIMEILRRKDQAYSMTKHQHAMII